jgi:hypothetical protein
MNANQAYMYHERKLLSGVNMSGGPPFNRADTTISISCKVLSLRHVRKVISEVNVTANDLALGFNPNSPL